MKDNVFGIVLARAIIIMGKVFSILPHPHLFRKQGQVKVKVKRPVWARWLGEVPRQTNPA